MSLLMMIVYHISYIIVIKLTVTKDNSKRFYAIDCRYMYMYMHMHIYMHVYMYMYMYIYIVVFNDYHCGYVGVMKIPCLITKRTSEM